MIRLRRSLSACAATIVFALALAAARPRAAHAQPPTPAETPNARAADLKKHVRKANAAYAHREWEEATSQLKEALTIAPEDARLRDKLRRALERRAQSREATAAHPPPPPPGMADGPRQGLVAIALEERRWHAELKREALEARAEAEAARTYPDEEKLARLRRDLAAVKADQADMARAVSAEQKRDAEEKSAEEKAFGGVTGLGLGGSRSPDAGLR
jgi:hypothetical protein